jgi:effector-binding domain-containing protein
MRSPESPLAVVAASTTWPEFPTLWGKLLDEVYAFLKTSGVTKEGHNVFVYKDDQPNVEIGVQVDAPFAPKGRVVPSALPAGEVAMTVHRGPYDKLGDAYDAVVRWCADNRRAMTRTRWEIYGDWREDPSELETEVHWLLR